LILVVLPLCLNTYLTINSGDPPGPICITPIPSFADDVLDDPPTGAADDNDDSDVLEDIVEIELVDDELLLIDDIELADDSELVLADVAVDCELNDLLLDDELDWELTDVGVDCELTDWELTDVADVRVDSELTDLLLDDELLLCELNDLLLDELDCELIDVSDEMVD